MVDSLRALAPKAVQVLAEALEGEASVSAAIHVLKICGFPGVAVAPMGAVDPRMVAAEMEMAENEAAHASEEATVAAKKKAYFRATDNLQYGL